MTGGTFRAALCLALLSLSACDQEDLENQRKLEPYEAAPGWKSGMSARHPPDGVVSRDARLEPRPPKPDLDMAALQKGRSRFEAVCAPCHGLLGDGQGIVVSRGFPSPPSFHSARLRDAPDEHFYDVITNGYGLMYPYHDRVPADGRWLVVGYIRALQHSQNADIATLPESLRAAIERGEDGNGGGR